MPIAIHRRGVVVAKKRWVFSTDKRSLPIECIYAYTPYLYAKFHLTHFGTHL